MYRLMLFFEAALNEVFETNYVKKKKKSGGLSTKKQTSQTTTLTLTRTSLLTNWEVFTQLNEYWDKDKFLYRKSLVNIHCKG
jgi:hypothetical protein